MTRLIAPRLADIVEAIERINDVLVGFDLTTLDSARRIELRQAQ